MNLTDKYSNREIRNAYVKYAMPCEGLTYNDKGQIIDLNNDNMVITLDIMINDIKNWLAEGISEQEIFG